MLEKTLFTSESVSEGHPDKICDQVSDAILDACLKIDPRAKVAVECFASSRYLLIGGEVKLDGVEPDYAKIAREVIQKIGYTKEEYDFSYLPSTKIEVKVKTQSTEITSQVDNPDPLLIGAGDQGMMFGYASIEDENYMPLAIVIAHKLVRYASNLRKEGKFPGSRPDMKSQVTIEYQNNQKASINNIVMSVSHDEGYALSDLRKFVYQNIILPVVTSFGLNTDFKTYININGTFIHSGPSADTGLTGRKIIVDTYGGAARHGGGAFSGKDATKVDRSAAYMARYIAKNLVAAGVAERLEVQLSYVIGSTEPLSYAIYTYKTKKEKITDEIILTLIQKFFDCRPGAIIRHFNLQHPPFKYADLANYGHFGRPDLTLPWEALDKVGEIQNYLKEKHLIK